MKRRIIETADKSKTLLIPDWEETYHSHHGAYTEAIHIFIESGLAAINKEEIAVFEMGFGSGLNAILTFDYAHQQNLKINYHGIEKHPLEQDELDALGYTNLDQLTHLKTTYESMHIAPWNVETQISEFFKLIKLRDAIEQVELKDENYDVIYYDAFGPRVQAELWSEQICNKMFKALKRNGVLVTYCAQGQFKRNLKAAGFHVEALAGPPNGKREMTRATKN